MDPSAPSECVLSYSIWFFLGPPSSRILVIDCSNLDELLAGHQMRLVKVIDKREDCGGVVVHGLGSLREERADRQS